MPFKEDLTNNITTLRQLTSSSNLPKQVTDIDGFFSESHRLLYTMQHSIGNLYEWFVDDNSYESTDSSSEDENYLEIESDHAFFKQRSRIQFLLWWMKLLLDNRWKSSFIENDLYFILQKVHSCRTLEDVSWSEKLLDTVTHDLLLNNALFEERLFNTRQPILRFDKVSNLNNLTVHSWSNDDITLSSLSVAMLHADEEKIHEERMWKSQNQDQDWHGISYTSLFEEKQYFYQCTFKKNNGNIKTWYYQKVKLESWENAWRIFYVRMWVDYGDEDDTTLWIPSYFSLFIDGPSWDETTAFNDDKEAVEKIIHKPLDAFEDWQDSDTGKWIPLGEFTQAVLQKLLMDDDITLDQLKDYIQYPYREWSLIDLIEDQVQDYWERLWWSLVLENEERNFIVSWMIKER